MKRILISAAAAAVSVMLCGNAFASVGAIDYWSNSRWTVKAIPMTSKCMANANYTAPDGEKIFVGFEVFSNGATGFLISSPRWTGMFHAGGRYRLDAQFDNYRSQRMLATAYGDGAIAFEGITLKGITAFAKSTSFHLNYNGRDLGTYNLPGSYDAVVKTLTCVKDWNNAVSTPAVRSLPNQPVPGI
ncbi:hypothetical protein [Rhizobium mayense]|uniref:DUF1349 domain-containing protein n=1 Tax=Rhizobium mayense TaxID=1312184 RepID=A0ABT7JQB5_9HYPH|nr:hypothetical protein [Rhizobium mayense]MDL2398441.1 hypothetical protein [Rhizobium mayense]